MSKIGTALPKSRLIKVEFFLALPIAATADEVEAWVHFNLSGGDIDAGNPLNDYDVEAVDDPCLTDSRLHLHTEVRPTAGGYQIITERKAEPYTGRDPADVINDLYKERKAKA